jgi:hypothetical protein
MDIFVWVITGIAVWHFAVFVPDRFWGGIVGAFAAAIAGAVLIGFIIHLVSGANIDDPGLDTLIVAATGSVVGLCCSYVAGRSRGEEPIPHGKGQIADMQE